MVNQLLQELKHSVGTERWHAHWINKNLVYTDSVHYLAKEMGSYWLIDEIGCVIFPRLVREFKDWFYHIQFQVLSDCSAIFNAGDGNGNIHFHHKIQWTDFPRTEKPITFYLCDAEGHYCLMLPSEY